MRVTNVIREKINRVVNQQVENKTAEMYAERRRVEKAIGDQLKVIREEADKKAAAILAKYPGTVFTSYRSDGRFISETSGFRLPEDKELGKQVNELRAKADEIKMDMEIHCQLEKDANQFFKMLEELSL